MIELTLAELADVVGGELVRPEDQGLIVTSVTIDSRKVEQGALFVPLNGERADGHAFVADAAARGARGYLQAAPEDLLDVPGAVVVDDPADALLGLGAWVRDTVNPTVVAVSGSAGKTTTKDLIAATVGAGRRVVANLGSYNNELGVPLTCCRLDADSEVLVAEIGSRGIGHIASLARLIRPDVAVVTGVSASHLELFGDVETVARAKAELVEALTPDGLAVLNADDPHVAAMAHRTSGRVATYGWQVDSGSADWHAADVRVDELARSTFRVVHKSGDLEVRLPLPGAHNIGNALAALAVAGEAGVDLESAAVALAAATVSPWRMQVCQTAGGVTVVNDAYNANPASMAAALRTLAAMRATGERCAVLGAMAELGETSELEHERAGQLCAEVGIDRLIVIGAAAKTIGQAAERAGLDTVAYLDEPDEAAAAVRAGARAGDVVLVKASRSVGLERVVALLTGGRGAS